MREITCHFCLIAFAVLAVACSDDDADTGEEDTTTITDAGDDTDSSSEQDGGQDAGHDARPDDGGLGCNGSPAYCDRPYNQVATVCTHNAMSNSEDWPDAIPTANQEYSFIKQLDDGVRCMMLDTYDLSGSPALCHLTCTWGSTLWTPMLVELAAWLASHPREVVTFILEANISEEATREALETSGIWDYVYHHDAPPGSPWPTLGTMVESNKRLVIFTDDETANNQWHLNWLVYGWETLYNDETFSCADNRGDPTAYDNQIFILNHYTLCVSGGCSENGEVNNAYDFMLNRADNCSSTHPDWNPWGQIPTFINVDHYHVPAPGAESPRADVFDVVQEINTH